MADSAHTQIAELIARSDDPFALCTMQYRRSPNAFWREVLGLNPDPWQIEANRALAHGHTRLAIRSGHGIGKAVSVSNYVDTPDAGRRRWGDLQPGDRLFGRDGEVTHIIARHDQGRRPIWRVIFDDGTFCRVDGEHLWTVRGRAQRRSDNKRLHRKGVGRTEQRSEYAADFITMTTAEIVRRGVKRPNGPALARQWEIPRHGAAQYPAQEIPLAPYLLGAWLADGNRFTGDGPSLLAGNAEKIELWQAAFGETMGRPRGAGDSWIAPLRGVMPALRSLGLAELYSHQRYVPEAFRFNTPTVRLAVLQGIMDADGYIGKDTGAAQLGTTSQVLAHDVAWLVRSLGGKAFTSGPFPSHYTLDGERHEARDHYKVTCRLPPDLPLFTIPSKASRLVPDPQARYLTRWIEAIEPDGAEEAMCVTVDAPDGLYLANDFIVTHNSTWAGATICWFSCTRAPFKIGVTAPSAPQLFDALWAETRSIYNRLPPAWRDLWQIDADSIKLKAAPDECFVTARTARADKPESLQGLHSANVLIIVDEASGVDEAVFNALRGSMSTDGAISVLIGNPVRSSGYFWRCHNLERDRWWTKQVSCVDSPRVARSFIQEIADGNGEDSNEYRIRVLGEFPLAEADTLIPAALVEGAMQRAVQPDVMHAEIWGVDVARFGADQSVLIKRRGPRVTEPPRRWRQVDTMALAGMIKAEYDGLPKASRPALIAIDAIGVGGGVVDRLLEQNLPILGVNVGEQPSSQGKFVRLRDELWVRCREWLESRAVSLPYDDLLRTDLTGPRVEYLSDGRMQVESKQKLRSRGYASPDSADALCLTFAAPGSALAAGLAFILTSKIPVRPFIKGME